MINVILFLGLYKVYVPSAIRAGWELSIGYFQVTGGAGIHVSLVPEGRAADVQLGAALRHWAKPSAPTVTSAGWRSGTRGRGGRPGR